MSKKKSGLLVKIILGILIVLVVLVVAGILFIDNVAKTAVVKGVPLILGNDITASVNHLHIEPLNLRVEVGDLIIGNPEGYSQDGYAQIGYPKMAELARYAKSKGVGLFLWYNSNGTWNDAPQGPRFKMDRSAARRQEMEWMQSIGILGIKVDFFGGDKQQMMQLYEDILTDANEFGLQVIFHGCTLPRGWERMYPNFVAAEAVLASENLHFGQGACDAEAKNGCTHTFIRNTVASMDFGGSALNKRYSANNDRGTTRRTSDVYALATAVLFQSSVQHFALAPNNLEDAPAWAIDFMKQVPTNWDEVRFIDGYPGKYAIIARRAGNTWYVAGINAEKQPLKKTITLPMFAKNSLLTVYADDAQLNGSVTQVKQNKKQQITITIPENGGSLIVGNFE